ncbi:MAG TPA: carbohydrate ABC transporter permease, partial [Symbiobacteriaceae bacterium]|nr:carbohydrate ABC transporter permease [Symbiobacteriaceae bacterium]
MRRGSLHLVGIYLVLALFLAFGLLPFLWIVSTSLKIPREYFSWPPQWIPSTFNWKNYAVLFTQYRFSGKLTNSLLVAGGTTFISVFAGAAGAYAMSRFRTGGRALASWLIIQRMAPPMTVVIALYFLAVKLRIPNTPLTLILAHTSVSLPFCVWMLKGFFDEIPLSL